jgi:hypothetical protein
MDVRGSSENVSASFEKELPCTTVVQHGSLMRLRGVPYLSFEQ